MGTRKSIIKIGLILTGDYNWAGGLYYVVNIIKTLNTLDDKTKPYVIVFYNNQTPKEILKEITFSNVSFENLDKNSLIIKGFYRLIRVISNRNYQFEHIINPHKLNALYPLTQYSHNLKNLNCEIVYWIYDFQHKFLPQLFEKNEVNRRDVTFNELSSFAKNIVVSSCDALEHFKLYYPNSKANVQVLRFVSIIDASKISTKEVVFDKFKIVNPYFVVANQFWKHKNHMVVLKAINKLKDEGIVFKIYFTGKQYDDKNPGYFKELSDYITTNNIDEFIYFTGFIPREEQLALIKHSKAVIQPSKFEGWSTVVEDCKALNKHLIVSNIAVHKEQLADNASFFNPDDFSILSVLIKSNLNNFVTYSNDNNCGYNKNIANFAEDILKVLNNLS